MGVPKFYRWISERYPKINQIITDNALLPEFDHLYLDMNGIIHGCTHPPEQDISTVLSERDMMMGIMQYLDRIITQIVKPKVSVYMAIDGVAPRAKLNQQRSRRYRSARDMAEALQALEDENPGSSNAEKKEMFDSNCITPGTEFLARVSEVIRYFIRKKIKEDPVWHNLTVIFSGHDIPGEGEHKIMDHIRQMRSQPGYQPNTRHCIYGQDADLIMLGLVTHEPHFTILREIVNFNSFSRGNEQNALKQVKKFTKESDFQLLHLSVLREYLAIEFCHRQTETYDLERCIDDFVFITFLVGNDFLPHLPTLDIGDGAFDMLFGLYKEIRVSWGAGNYLTCEGEISDPARLESFLAAIGTLETEILEQKKKDEAAYIKKKRRWDKRDGKPQGPSDEEIQQAEAAKQLDYQGMLENLLTQHQQEDYVEGWQPVTPIEEDYKGRYYYEKLQFTPVDKDKHWQLRKSYMEGLMWCLAYYYRGCISWGWYYPYHYGPMLSDLIGVSTMFEQISFEIGEPLTPFQQLMACLPPGSADLVPKLYRWLMTTGSAQRSPIIEFYPETFVVDMNGKKNPWEGVNLLPFIDVQVLKDTIAKYCPDSKLSVAERKRNAFGKVFAYHYDVSCTDKVESPCKKIGLPDFGPSCSSSAVVEEPAVRSPPFQPRLIPGSRIPFAGFPSLTVVPLESVDYVSIGLNCFGTASKYPTCLLTMQQMGGILPLPELAKGILGKPVFVNWPMMHEAKIVAISDETQEIRNSVRGPFRVKEFSEETAERWRTETGMMQQMYYVGDGTPGSGGVNIGEILVRLKVLPLQGMKVNPSNGSTKKIFGREEADVPLQLALLKAPAPDPRFQERAPLALGERFPVGCKVVLTKGKYRGCVGEVVGVPDRKTVGVKVQTQPAEPPFGLALAQTIKESHISSNEAARILKIHPGVLGKIAGRLQFEQGRYDLGLNLKSADGMCVAGYTRKKVETKTKATNNWAAGDTVRVVGSKRDSDATEDRIIWEYTPKAIRLIESYKNKFPQLFAGITMAPNEKKYDANVVFGPNGESWLPLIREWLNNVDSAKLPRSPVSTQILPHEGVVAVERASGLRILAMKKKGFPKASVIKIPGDALYREGSTGATNILLASDLNNKDAPQLGDRVVNLAADGIPFGLRGTVVSIHEAATTGSVEVVMDEEFIGGTTLQGMCSKFRGKLCLWSRLLKVAPDDTIKQVDKLVPKGTGKAAVEKILSSIHPAAKAAPPIKPVKIQSNPARKASPVPPKPAAAPEAQTSDGTKTLVAGRAPSSGRAGSTQKGRQGGWREARGPSEHDLGFKWKGKRKGKSGVERWKDAVETANNEKAAQQLKAVLGMAAAAREPGSGATESGAASGANESAALNLKSVLGVGAEPSTDGPQNVVAAESAHLKAVLGVQNSDSTKQPPPPPVGAADKLLQMMASTQAQMYGGPMYHQPMPGSGFNFTYVEGGQIPPPPPQPAFGQPMQPMHSGMVQPAFPPPPPVPNPNFYQRSPS